MKAPQAPRLDTRRTGEFRQELLERARAWIPTWDLSDEQHDFGKAIVDIAARFSAEVTERLDGAGEKMRRGFLDWLAVRGQAARPSRVPVVLKLTDSAREAVLAEAPVRLQADAGGVPVVFETEKDVRVIPGALASVVAVDPGEDAFYLPAPGLSDLQPLEPVPVEWELKTFAAAGAKKLQVTPDTGLLPGMIVEGGGWQYEIDEADKEIITVIPPLTNSLEAGTILRKVSVFAPFEAGARNRQEHAVYIGHADILNLEAEATIDVVGLVSLGASVKWQYWGKVGQAEESDWRALTLAPTQKNDAVVLKKPAGALDVRDINGVSSRWIRAYAVKSEGNPLQVDSIELRINCQASPLACTPVGTEPPSPAAQAMANTTPLVLDKQFFPLGKEPRQFDAFYLGSQEAFSKKDAKVQLCFELADPSFRAMSAVRQGSSAHRVLAGVGRDRALHLFNAATGDLTPLNGRDPLQPPSPAFFGGTPDGDLVVLDSQPAWRPPVWSEPDWFGSTQGFLVAVTAGDSVWLWHEHPVTVFSGWLPFGDLPQDTVTPSRPIEGLVFLGEPPARRMAALRGGKLYVRQWPGGLDWDEVEPKNGVTPVQLVVIAPITLVDLNGETGTAKDVIAISSTKKMFSVDVVTGQCTPILPARDFKSIAPMAHRNALGTVKVIAVEDVTPGRLVATGAGLKTAALDTSVTVTGALDSLILNDEITALACLQGAGDERWLAAWTPYGPEQPPPLFATLIAPGIGTPAGGPALVGSFVMVPTSSTAVLVASFDLTRRLSLSTPVTSALVTRDDADQIVPNDFVGIPVAAVFPSHQLEKITTSGVRRFGKTMRELDFESIDGNVLLYRDSTQPFQADMDPANLQTITLPAGDTVSRKDTILLITTDNPALYQIATFAPLTGVAKLDRPLAYTNVPANPGTVPYKRPESTAAVVLPLLALTGAAAIWDAAILDRTKLFFPGVADPRFQTGEAFQIASNGHPELVVLGQHWTTPPANAATAASFIVDGTVGGFAPQLGDTSKNPELSWEYWNGRGWWGLAVTLDGTAHLKKTGAVQFDVPGDLVSSDWAGQTNHWIRARLIGGDYGREKTTVVTTTTGNVSSQTVNRSTDGIRAPSVVKLHISYQLCTPVLPTFVLAQDSGSYRNQSDANRTPGAQIEAFVPLGVMLGRLSSTGAAAVPADAHECPPPCQCDGATPIAAATPTASPAGTSSVLNAPPATGRAVLIGLTKPPSEAPVNVLLLVDRERDYSALAPMAIEALVADRFLPIVADDTTRALGESGVLSLAFAVPPTPREMFGKTLSWLQMKPAAPAAASSTASPVWSPTLRGAYLNAVWASATETLTRELLGSSDGAPRMTFTLARPPLLKDSLELRVREPLGDEERLELQARDDKLVLNNLQDLPGDWVRWTRVIDPGDESPDARVYGLDETTGRVTFGDGLHGMIPPIGRDAIVAFSYQRTETGAGTSGTVPGNTIAARTPFNLVSPVEGVEAVIAADQAAGGAPPESDDRVLRFGFATLRHRRRAVTARDLEDLALQSSPDFAQARCLIRQGYARLIVVMRGTNPQPNASQVRELRRLLLDASPVALAAPGALRIEGPAVRRLRVSLTLQIPSLDVAGDVGRDVKKGLAQLFDTASGGADGQGWMLGQRPADGDIAYALMDVPSLESVAGVVLRESKGRRSETSWPESFKPSELAVLAEDPVRLQFVTAEVIA